MSSDDNKDKINKPLSAPSLCKTVSKYATRAQTDNKVCSSNKLIHTTDPEPNTSSDQLIMLSDNINALAEDYTEKLQKNGNLR